MLADFWHRGFSISGILDLCKFGFLECGYLLCWVSRCLDFYVFDFRVYWILECVAFWTCKLTSGFSDFWIYMIRDCLAFWICGCLHVWIVGYGDV